MNPRRKYDIYEIIDRDREIPKDILNIIDLYTNKNYDDLRLMVERLFENLVEATLVKDTSFNFKIFMDVILDRLLDEFGLTFSDFLAKHGNEIPKSSFSTLVYIIPDSLIQELNVSLGGSSGWGCMAVIIDDNLKLFAAQKAFEENYIKYPQIEDLKQLFISLSHNDFIN